MLSDPRLFDSRLAIGPLMARKKITPKNKCTTCWEINREEKNRTGTIAIQFGCLIVMISHCNERRRIFLNLRIYHSIFRLQ